MVPNQSGVVHSPKYPIESRQQRKIGREVIAVALRRDQRLGHVDASALLDAAGTELLRTGDAHDPSPRTSSDWCTRESPCRWASGSVSRCWADPRPRSPAEVLQSLEVGAKFRERTEGLQRGQKVGTGHAQNICSLCVPIFFFFIL